MIKFEDLGLETLLNYKEIEIQGGTKLQIRDYLPIDKKAEMVTFIVDHALDEMTGCFSPIRTEVFFAIALCKWYADIEFENLLEAGLIYDKLDNNGIVNEIVNNIPEEEYEFLAAIVKETIDDIARYNSSAAGIIHGMADSSNGINNQLENIFNQIKNAEGLEILAPIKDMVGSN